MHNKALSNTTKCEFRYNKISQDHCINNDGIYWTDYNGWIIVEFINDL